MKELGGSFVSLELEALVGLFENSVTLISKMRYLHIVRKFLNSFTL